MANKMLDSLYCECGGKYIHVDEDVVELNHRGDALQDTYQCDHCRTWCIITSRGGEEIDREYEDDETN